ncbi:MAG: FAD-dependent oxidoreductase [Acidimicrobiia bacterium]|nr:FAD-dependent oxidoreductase [Acidimicrobiia bacterium]
MRVVVIGAGMAGLTAARLIAAEGHGVTVLDKGRRPGGRMATKELGGGASADHGAQFFTVRTEAFSAVVEQWVADGIVHEWCRGFSSEDGHPRFAVARGMAELAAHMSVGLDVCSSVHVDAVRSAGRQWEVTWPATQQGAAGLIETDVVVLTPPAPQAAALVASEVTIRELAYEPMLSLLVALGDPASVPSPGGVQLEHDPTWSWIGDNVAKGASTAPAVTLHTRADVAVARWDEANEALTSDLLHAAEPWVRGAEIIDVRLHRWRYATPLQPQPEPCLVRSGGRLVFAGDAFGGPRVEGAFLSGRAAADAVVNGNL